MNWFYATKDKTQAGPVDETTLSELLRSGTITPETLIWKEGMDGWKPYSAVLGLPGQFTPAPTLAPGQVVCAECGQTFAVDQTVSIGGRLICAGCKPLALQRFQEGGSALAEPMEPEALWAKVLDRGGKVDIGTALSGAWRTYSGNFGPCLGVTLLVYLITMVPGNIPFIGVLFAIPMFFLVQQQMTAGLLWYFVKQIRGGRASLDDAFTGFRRGFGQQALFSLFYAIAMFIIFLPAIIAYVVSPGDIENKEPSALFVIFVLVGLLICAYIGLRWMFTTILILDKGQPALAAMKLSGRAAHRNALMLIVLFIIAFLLAAAGLAALCIGMIFVAPYVVAMFANTYNQIFGQEGSIEKV